METTLTVTYHHIIHRDIKGQWRQLSTASYHPQHTLGHQRSVETTLHRIIPPHHTPGHQRSVETTLHRIIPPQHTPEHRRSVETTLTVTYHHLIHRDIKGQWRQQHITTSYTGTSKVSGGNTHRNIPPHHTPGHQRSVERNTHRNISPHHTLGHQRSVERTLTVIYHHIIHRDIKGQWRQLSTASYHHIIHRDIKGQWRQLSTASYHHIIHRNIEGQWRQHSP